MKATGQGRRSPDNRPDFVEIQEAAKALNITIEIRNNDNNIIRSILPATSVAGGAVREFPTKELSSDDGIASAEFIVVAGVEDFHVLLASVNVNDDSLVSLYGLVSGGPPTVTLTSPTGATETETANEIP